MSVTNLDEQRLGRDLALPLTADDTLQITATGDIPSVAGRRNLGRAVQRRVLTSAGDLVHRPEYGAGLGDALELQNTPERRSQLSNAIRRNLLRDARLRDARAQVSAGIPDSTGRETAVSVGLTVELRHDRSRQELSVKVE